MSEYQLRQEVDSLKKELTRQEVANMAPYVAIGTTLGLEPRIVQALLKSAMMSDHETITKAVKQLLFQTKLVHPEEAYRVEQELSMERKHIQQQHDKHAALADELGGVKMHGNVRLMKLKSTIMTWLLETSRR